MDQHVSLNGSIFIQIFSTQKQPLQPKTSSRLFGPKRGISWSFVHTWASTGLQNTRRLKETTEKSEVFFVFENTPYWCVSRGWMCFFVGGKIDTWWEQKHGLMVWCMMGLSLGLGVDGFGVDIIHQWWTTHRCWFVYSVLFSRPPWVSANGVCYVFGPRR